MPAHFTIVSTDGHVYSMKFKDNESLFNKDPYKILSDLEIDKYHVKRSTERVRRRRVKGRIFYGPNYKYLQEYLVEKLTGSDLVMLWLDNDQSGDATSQQMIDLINFYCKIDNRFILRADCSSLATTDIWKSFTAIAHYNDYRNALGHDTRSEIDYRVGLSFSVFQSKYLNKIVSGNLNVNNKFSYGPCLFPTLYFCTKRVFDMLYFNPEKHWRVILTFVTENGQKVEIEHTSQFDSYDEAIAIISSIRGKRLLLNDSRVQHKTIKKPSPLDTTKLLMISSRLLGLSSSDTSTTVQKLYEQGFVSYPRTAGTTYSKEKFNSFSKTLETITNKRGLPQFTLAQELLSDGLKDDFVEDAGFTQTHHPITPVNQLKNRSRLKDKRYPQRFELYNLISSYFMATLSTDCNYDQTTYNFDINSQKFSYTESVVTHDGFTKFYDEPLSSIEDLAQEKLSATIGYSYKVESMKVVEVKQTPPEYLTEEELIKLMKTYGIGTEGTIPRIIKNIKFRKYVEVCGKSTNSASDRLKPTALGLALAIGYKAIDSSLIEPQVRYFIEKCNKKVSMYELEKDTVLQKVTEIFTHKLNNFEGKFKSHLEPVLKSLMSNSKQFDLPDFKLEGKQTLPGGFYISDVKKVEM